MSSFACSQCGKCCSNLGGERIVILLPDDIKALMNDLDISKEKFFQDFARLNISVSEEVGHDVYELRHVEGICVFLGRENRCLVHDFKPFQCRYGPNMFMATEFEKIYECMQGVEIIDTSEVDGYFFKVLVEEKYDA
ncbi:hypothetical protein TH8_17200 [Thalassospira profundimaris]|nr:hypothetical protein TH8_17200 [Thalassospira profundimaris]